ncbi:MAG TPA: DUF1801 domain-containing protein [Gemmatimonadaceae bacterium]
MPTAKASPDPKRVRALVQKYFATSPPRQRRRLKEMRAAIRAAAPQATEYFSYRMPAFRLDGKVLVWYAAFTHHTSLFPITAGLKRRFAADLRGLETSKGTVRFALDKPLPVTVLKRLVKGRVAEVRRRDR